MTGKDQDRGKSGDAARHAEVAARPTYVQNGGVNDERDPAGESGAQTMPSRHAFLAWQEAAHLKEHPAYAELLGTPTVRERFFALWHRLGETHLGIAAPSPRWALAALAAVVLLSGAWFLRPHGPDYATRVAEIRDVRLNDGSVVTLGARSALDVDFTPAERTVRLTSGEAFFSISHDVSRPFVVLAGDKRIRVVGTKFNVNYDGRHIRVSVQQGIVDVMRGTAPHDAGRAPPADSVRLVAGQQIAAAAAGPLEAPEPLRGAEPGAWRSGRLNYQDASLAEIVSDANRYRAQAIRIASPSLANERLTTSFSISQIDQMLETLPNTLPVVVKRDADGSIALQRSVQPGR